MTEGTREAELIAEIERLELTARDLKRRRESVASEEDGRVLDRQRDEVRREIERLRERLSPRPARLVVGSGT